MNPFNEQAAFLIEDAVDLIKQVLVKHSAAVLEEMHDQIVSRNARIATLESELAQLRADVEGMRVPTEVNKALTGREDRTPLKTTITTHDEAVFIEFSRPTLNMGMTAADTLTFAEGLIKAARSLGATRKIEV